MFRCGPDARAYVVGSSDENELILNMVLDGLVDALTALLGGTFDARTCFENLETAMLCVDEVVDGGAILETTRTPWPIGSDARRRGRPAHHGHDRVAVSTIRTRLAR